MIDLNKIDWRTPPGGIIQALTHRYYADWLWEGTLAICSRL